VTGLYNFAVHVTGA